MMWSTMIECLWNVYDVEHDDSMIVECGAQRWNISRAGILWLYVLKDHLILSKMEGFWGAALQWVPQK